MAHMEDLLRCPDFRSFFLPKPSRQSMRARCIHSCAGRCSSTLTVLDVSAIVSIGDHHKIFDLRPAGAGVGIRLRGDRAK